MHWVSLHVLFFLVIFCLLLVFFLRDVLGSNVAVRGGNLLVSTVFFCDGAGLPGIFCISFHGRSRHSRVVEVRWRTLAVYDRG